MNDTTTMSDVVNAYMEHGATPFPLPEDAKCPPLRGVTGNTKDLTTEEIRALWEGVSGSENVGIRVPDDVIGIDVDHYGEKTGADTLHDLEDELGELPPTWSSTRRGENSVSRKYFYSVPTGKRWKSPGKDIDVIQHTHRYAVVFPSVVDGLKEEWYGPDGQPCEIPSFAALPALPESWVDRLQTGHRATAAKAPARGYKEALTWLESRVFAGNSRNPHTLEWEEGSRYDSMNSDVLTLVNNAVHRGHSGLLDDLTALCDAYVAEVGEDRAGEFERSVVGAVSIVEGEIASDLKQEINWRERFGAEPFPDDYAIPDFGDLLAKQAKAYLSEMIEEEKTTESLEEVRAAAVAAVEASAPEDYWQTQPVLADIAHYATRASVDKYALLFRVLTYLSAEMPPTVYLEDMGQPLTLYSAVIAESGAGKGVLDKVADALVGQQLYNGDPVLRPGTGNLHTLLTALGDFTRPPMDKETGEQTMPMKKHRMLIQGNELAAWAEMQGNAEWAGAMADVFDGKGDYEVRNTANCYHFGVNQHSLAVTFSVQPDAAGYLFASTGRGLPGRFLISALPPQERVLPEDFDPWDLDSDFEVDTFDPARDVSRLKINSRFFLETGPFHLSDDARKVNARLKRAWDEELGEYKQLRAEKIFSQMPKVKLRVAVLLTVLLDLGEGREVPLEALKMADFLLKVSVENTRYARALADTEERRGNAAVAAERKRADADADLSLAKENVLAVIDKSKSGRAGLATMNQRKRATAEDHPAAIAELVVEGVLEVVETDDGRVSYRRK